MSKPILNIEFITPDDKKGEAKALFDSGSFPTILRENMLPKGTKLLTYKKKREFGLADRKGKIEVTASITLIIKIGNKMIETSAFISPDLKRELLIGAGTMQTWDISIKNKNGKTFIVVGLDMRDEDIIMIE
ncbi:MAG: hypothetical protein IIA88_03795 [Bacteroidetes bacterium]|nr:hypothetical protein [Bacteroidota bacterium]